MCKELGQLFDISSCASRRPVCTKKKKPFRFLINDEQGDTSSERYARSAQIVLLVACRIYEDADSYPKSDHAPSVKESVANVPQHVRRRRLRAVSDESTSSAVEHILGTGGLRSGALSLFSSVVCACLCTTTDRGSAARCLPVQLPGADCPGSCTACRAVRSWKC